LINASRKAVAASRLVSRSSLEKAIFAVRSIATKKLEFFFLGSHLDDVDVEEADRIGLELLSDGLIAFDIRQPADPMPGDSGATTNASHVGSSPVMRRGNRPVVRACVCKKRK